MHRRVVRADGINAAARGHRPEVQGDRRYGSPDKDRRCGDAPAEARHQGAPREALLIEVDEAAGHAREPSLRRAAKSGASEPREPEPRDSSELLSALRLPA